MKIQGNSDERVTHRERNFKARIRHRMKKNLPFHRLCGAFVGNFFLPFSVCLFTQVCSIKKKIHKASTSLFFVKKKFHIPFKLPFQFMFYSISFFLSISCFAIRRYLLTRFEIRFVVARLTAL